MTPYTLICAVPKLLGREMGTPDHSVGTYVLRSNEHPFFRLNSYHNSRDRSEYPVVAAIGAPTQKMQFSPAILTDSYKMMLMCHSSALLN